MKKLLLYFCLILLACASAHAGFLDHVNNESESLWFLNDTYLVNNTGNVKDFKQLQNGTYFGLTESEILTGLYLDNGIDGSVNGSFKFDGINDYVEFNKETGNITGNITVSFWFKSNVVPSLNNIPLVERWRATNTGYMMTLENTHKMRFYTQGSFIRSNTIFNTDTWYYAVGLINQSGKFLFINGELDNYDYTQNLSTVNVEKLQLGYYDEGGLYFNGSLDDVRIYNRSLSSLEIDAIYRSRYQDVGLLTVTANYTISNASISSFALSAVSSSTTFQSSTTNGTLIIALPPDDYDITITSDGYKSQTRDITITEGSYNSEFFNLLAEGDYIVNVFNASDGSRFTQDTSLKLIGDGQERSYTIADGLKYLHNLTLGELYQFQFVSAGFSNSYYDNTFSISNYETNAYMADNGTEIEFLVQDVRTTKINDATIQIEAFVQGNYTLIGQRLTDILGIARFNLEDGTQHRITITKNGYQTQQFTLEIDSTDSPYTITLEDEVQIDFENVYSDMFFKYTPLNSTLYPTVHNFSLRIYGPNIENYGIRLYNGSNLIASSNLTSGNYTSISFNVSPYINTTLIGHYFFERENFSIVIDTQTYYIVTHAQQYSTDTLRAYMVNNVNIGTRFALWGIACFILFLILVSISFQQIPIPAQGLIITMLVLSVIIGYFAGISLFFLGFLAVILILYIIFGRGGNEF